MGTALDSLVVERVRVARADRRAAGLRRSAAGRAAERLELRIDLGLRGAGLIARPVDAVAAVAAAEQVEAVTRDRAVAVVGDIALAEVLGNDGVREPQAAGSGPLNHFCRTPAYGSRAILPASSKVHVAS